MICIKQKLPSLFTGALDPLVSKWNKASLKFFYIFILFFLFSFISSCFIFVSFVFVFLYSYLNFWTQNNWVILAPFLKLFQFWAACTLMLPETWGFYVSFGKPSYTSWKRSARCFRFINIYLMRVSIKLLTIATWIWHNTAAFL